jgi:hypothetical protein
MANDDAKRFREQAEECRQQAEKAKSPLDKEAWLRVAGEWIKLAQAPTANDKRPPQLVGWVERLRNPSRQMIETMGFASLNPSYGLVPEFENRSGLV